MHRIDGPGATVDNKFTDGDPVGGVQATVVTDDWLNAVQEEVARVIENAGIVLSKSKNGQLLEAIDLKVTSAIPSPPPDASTTVKGIVELATDTETQEGTDAAKAVTAAGLASVLSGKQDADATLSALAELAVAANKLIYATGADTFATTDLTAFARTLLDDADAAAAKATLQITEPLGVGQSWQDVTAIRALGTTYTNTTGRPIQLWFGFVRNTVWSVNITVNGVTSGGAGYCPIIPAGSTYSISASGITSIKWLELR